MKIFTLILFLFLGPSVMGQDQSVQFSQKEIDLALLKKTYAHLSPEAFDLKLSQALKRPLMFFRSYPNTYYADTKLSAQSPQGLCYGDAHPENFGFMKFDEQTLYRFNDLDDAGTCPLLLDSLRYFSALRLWGGIEEAQIKELVHVYVNALKNVTSIPSLPESLQKDLEKKRKKNLKKFTKEQRFIADEELTHLSEAEKTRLGDQLKDKLAPLKLHDIVQNIKDDGGSAGLKRYWVLISDSNQVFDILEFKPRQRAATSWGTGDETIANVVEIAHEIWGDLPQFFGQTQLEQKAFQVRSRSKDDLNLDKLEADEVKTVLSMQTLLLAQHHRQQLAQNPWEVEVNWILEQSKTIEERYRQALEQLAP